MVAPEPAPNPPPHSQNSVDRPDLRLVPPPESDAEITGPIPAVGEESTTSAATDDQDDTEPAAAPQAPLDVRFLEHLGEVFQARPRWSERSPSMAETWEYSTSGDWTAEEKSAKRLAHGLCVLLAFAATYPIDWAVQIARCKPIGFVLSVAVLFVLSKVL